MGTLSLISLLTFSLFPIVYAQSGPQYPQPALPSNKAINDPKSWTLNPNFEITDVPETREYFWNMRPVAASPDGYPRQIYAVNDMFPGPLIEANQGDTIKVHITNNLPIGQTIHWHGIYQNGSQWMDGVPGISQCPIGPGRSFTYEFKLDHQYGSYWWHSHYGNTMADGIVGGLIVHSVNDPVKRGVDFDEEMLFMVQDWMDIQSTDVVAGLHSAEGYRGAFGPPQGNAILINGIGQTNCSNEDIQDHDLECLLPDPPEFPITASKRIKLRILNIGTYGMFRISIDSHAFDIVELDDTAVWGPTSIHEAQIAAGQRMSIIINTDKGVAGDAWYLRANVVTSCIGRAGIVQTGLAVLRYVDEDGTSPFNATVNSTAWNDLQGAAAKCQDLDAEYSIAPREAKDAPKDIIQTHVLSSTRGNFLDKSGARIGGFGFNDVPYQAQVGNPLISQIQAGVPLNDTLVAHVTYDGLGGGDLILNNLDANIAHPYHLHGKPFFIIARGSGSLTVAQWEAQRSGVNTVNPLRRDVIQIPTASYAVLRLVTDLPGVWPLHCHIGWHLSEGKLAAIIVRPDAIRSLSQPQEWKDLCKDYGYDDIGPARRALPSQNTTSHGTKSDVKSGFRQVNSRLARTGPREQ